MIPLCSWENALLAKSSQQGMRLKNCFRISVSAKMDAAAKCYLTYFYGKTTAAKRTYGNA